MNTKDKLSLKGKMFISAKDAQGNAVKLWNENKIGRFLLHKVGMDLRIPLLTGNFGDKVVRNLIVDAGLAGLASRLNGSGAEPAFTYLALGTGTTAAVAGNTTLEAEIIDTGLERTSATVSRETDTATNDTAVLTSTWTATGAKSVTECGALNASSVGTLLGRQVFTSIGMTSGMSLQITYKFTIS